MDHSEIAHLPKVDHTPAELDAPARLLLRAAMWIEEHGWIQGTMEKRQMACTLGALSLAAHEIEVLTGVIIDAEVRLKRRLPEPYSSDSHDGSLCAVAAWNDAPGRTKDEVIAKLRAAALGL
jgi:hypothetical protein